MPHDPDDPLKFKDYDMEEKKSDADKITEQYETIIDEAIRAYNDNPESLPPYLRAAVENLLGMVDNPYETQ